MPKYCTIKTIHGEEFFVSSEDAEAVATKRWTLDPKGNVRSTQNGATLLLTQFLIPQVGKGLCRDHINRNKLDNRRENLRVVSFRLNNLNHSGHSHTQAGNIPGVQWHKASQKWRAYAYRNKKQIHLGLFPTQEEAIFARVSFLKTEGIL